MAKNRRKSDREDVPSKDVLIGMLDDVLHKLEDRVDTLAETVNQLVARVDLLELHETKRPQWFYTSPPHYPLGQQPIAQPSWDQYWRVVSQAAGGGYPAQATFGMSESGRPNPTTDLTNVLPITTPLTKSMDMHPSSVCPICQDPLRGAMLCGDEHCPKGAS